jgi:hypothetical protein
MDVFLRERTPKGVHLDERIERCKDLPCHRCVMKRCRDSRKGQPTAQSVYG